MLTEKPGYSDIQTVLLSFGRFNPPTAGHEKLVKKVLAMADAIGADSNIFVSPSQNSKQDPLDCATKISFLREIFPEHTDSFVNDPEITTPVKALLSASAKGYKNVTIVVGSDRVRSFTELANRYNGDKMKVTRT